MKRKNSYNQKLLLHLSFTGTNFRGFQYQKKGKTVQKEIENALKKINFEPKIVGCSRTDGGVHSRNFFAHTIYKDPDRGLKEILKGLNSNLSEDILIKSVARVSEDYHARFSASSKIYRYFLFLGDNIPPPVEPFVTKFFVNLDIEKMGEILFLFIGKKDFRAFTTSEGRKISTLKEILSVSIFEKKPLICIEIKGKSFLHRMVRFLVSALVSYGRGKVDKNFLAIALEGKVDFLPFPAMPAKGLHLWDVEIDKGMLIEKYDNSCPLPLWPFESIDFEKSFHFPL